MRKFVITAAALAVALSAVPAHARGGHAGLGVDISDAGNGPEEHRAFFNTFEPEDQAYIKQVCKIEYKHRKAEEKEFCESIKE